MKKILTVSIMAVMAVTAANAEIASKAYVDQNIGTISTYGNATNVAAAIANAIAGVSETAGTALQSVTANAGAGVVTNIAADGTAVTMTKAKVTGSDIADNANIAKTQLATEVQTSLGKADTAQQPATTLAGYGITDAYTKDAADAKFDTIAHVGTIPAGSSATTVIGYVDEKAAAATNGMLTTSNYATTLDPVYINANEVTSTYAADGTAPVTGAAVNAAITSLDLANTYQAKGDYATAEQGTKADTALQPTAASGTTGTKLVEYNATTGLVTGGQAAGALATLDEVDSAQIKDGAVASADIADGAVILAKLGGTLPTECTGANPTHECVLKSTASGLGWEKIQRSTTGE